MDRLVVIGASLAGLRAAQAARAAGFSGELVVVGAEPHPPYTRPPLSKELLYGAQSAEQCSLPSASLEVTWRLGTAATGLDRARKEVRLDGGERLPYDRLIAATGSRARPWHGPGSNLAGVHTLRTLDDSLALRDALAPGVRLLIAGAGFIGCEVAASARKLGAEVTVVDIAEHPMLPLGPELGARCARLHASHGVEIRCRTGLARLRGHERVRGAELSDGSRVEADLVLMALGALPNVEWLAGCGLALDPGLACDSTLTAEHDPDILAAGDIVSWPHPLAAGARVRVEHWTTAAEQGQLAGRNALLEPGERVPHHAPPYFWSDQYETKIQAVGFPTRAEQFEVLEQSQDGERLVAVGGRAGRLTGVIALNAAKRLAWYRRRLASLPELDEVRAEVLADASALGEPVGAAR